MQLKYGDRHCGVLLQLTLVFPLRTNRAGVPCDLSTDRRPRVSYALRVDCLTYLLLSMRFKSSIPEVNTFIKVVASLNQLGSITWMRIDDENVRFTVIPEQGSQVWAVLPVYSIFGDDFTVQSASELNVINLEVPLGPLHTALKSAQDCSAASLRLTKKDGAPLLCLTINTTIQVTSSGRPAGDPVGAVNGSGDMVQSKETTISQDVPIRVLAAASVEGIHEPRCKEPEVIILLPPLNQIKTISERFTRIALASKKAQAQSSGLQSGGASLGQNAIRLELGANMHGELSVSIKTDALNVQSKWKGLVNPELDPAVVENGETGIREHPSTRWRELEGDEAWATVRVEGKDWGRVLGVGRLGGRVVACFCDGHALILYVYLPKGGGDGDDNEAVLTVRVPDPVFDLANLA